MIEIKMDDKALRFFLKTAPKQTLEAARAAMKRTAQMASTELVRAMKESSWLTAKDLRGGLMRPAFSSIGGGIEAEIRVRGKGFGMDHYKVKPKRVTARKGRRSTLWTPPSWQTGPIGSWHVTPHSFMAIMKHGKKPLFMVREGAKLRRLYGPSPQYFAAFATVRERLGRHVRKVYPQRFQHELSRILSK